jgi:antitoxin ParD1/3/4
MAKRITANVSLTPQLNDFVERLVASGRYQTSSEVFREALRLLEHRERQPITTFEELKREVNIGLKQAKAGLLLDGPTVMEEIRRKYLGKAGKRIMRRRGG